jgi:hypothetical protein
VAGVTEVVLALTGCAEPAPIWNRFESIANNNKPNSTAAHRNIAMAIWPP